MLTLQQVLAKVSANESDADRTQLERRVRDVIAAVGLEVNPRTGEVYSPAPPQRTLGRRASSALGFCLRRPLLEELGELVQEVGIHRQREKEQHRCKHGWVVGRPC